MMARNSAHKRNPYNSHKLKKKILYRANSHLHVIITIIPILIAIIIIYKKAYLFTMSVPAELQFIMAWIHVVS